ncbi:hypothetical protein PI23P_02412 [Polaribacter irgensii 23-P]|uniref:GvpL/GvpF family gas vesicle protein n=1 Tax=Polaribacter irgensii 23-P TaxID=313594 RepID=A4BWG9_9FLAO|nr:GvpL/GvpF family gas vesicle protein [Polaribacter irgensii]EAR13310.1 hypothetical protein PI23P_02412 [Polaribacter irgensii 23-P]
MVNELTYVYCISDSPLPVHSISDQKDLECLKFGTFYGYVKKVSPDEFSEENLNKNFNNLPWIERHARNHIRIIGEIMKSSIVIPFKFGTVFNSEESLGNFIQKYTSSLNENLKNIKGKEEWSVKIYCNYTVLNEEIMELSEDVRNLEQEISKSKPGKSFLLKRKKVELIEKEVAKVVQLSGQICYEEVKRFSELTQVNSLLSAEHSDRKDSMILNISCFVNQVSVTEFIDAIGELQKKYKKIGFDISTAGPWPPFSFTSIKEK